MVALAFSQLADPLGKRQRFGEILEAEDAVEARVASSARTCHSGASGFSCAISASLSFGASASDALFLNQLTHEFLGYLDFDVVPLDSQVVGCENDDCNGRRRENSTRSVDRSCIVNANFSIY